MTVIVALVVAVGVAVPGVVAADLLSDVPRLATWIARRAEQMLRPSDRNFYGWVPEIEEAALEAADGRRSRLPVLGAAGGMVVAAVRQRIKARRVEHAVEWGTSSEVKIHLPTCDPDGFQSESVWATWIGEDDHGDLYRIDNHVVFSDLAGFGDVVRAEYQPLDDMPGYGVLEFVEVVTEAEHTEVSLWHSWRILPKSRFRRLHRRLRALGMNSEWMASRIGRGNLPEGPNREAALVLLHRRRVSWEVVERTLPPTDANHPGVQ